MRGPGRRRACKCAGPGPVSQTRISGRTNDRDSDGNLKPGSAGDPPGPLTVRPRAGVSWFKLKRHRSPHLTKLRTSRSPGPAVLILSLSGWRGPGGSESRVSGDSESSFKFSQSPATLRKPERARAHRDQHPSPAAAAQRRRRRLRVGRVGTLGTEPRRRGPGLVTRRWGGRRRGRAAP